MSNTTLIGILVALALVAAAIIATLAVSRHEKNREAMLRRRFGPEYERAREQLGRGANGILAERVRHVERLHIRALTDEERQRFGSEWTKIQAQFVDDPRVAVAKANELIQEVMNARGYEKSSAFDQRCADLSVDHPEVIEHYRAADELARSPDAPTSTEDLRQAVVHYRVIFADLLEQPPMEPANRVWQPRHA